MLCGCDNALTLTGGPLLPGLRLAPEVCLMLWGLLGGHLCISPGLTLTGLWEFRMLVPGFSTPEAEPLNFLYSILLPAVFISHGAAFVPRGLRYRVPTP